MWRDLRRISGDGLGGVEGGGRRGRAMRRGSRRFDPREKMEEGLDDRGDADGSARER